MAGIRGTNFIVPAPVILSIVVSPVRSCILHSILPLITPLQPFVAEPHSPEQVPASAQKIIVALYVQQ